MKAAAVNYRRTGVNTLKCYLFVNSSAAEERLLPMRPLLSNAAISPGTIHPGQMVLRLYR